MVDEKMNISKECGLLRVLPWDEREHNAYGRRFQATRDRFGPDKVLSSYRAQEQAKADGWRDVFDDKLPLLTRAVGAEWALIGCFSRSVCAAVHGRYDHKHPDFGTYVAMRLGQADMRDAIPEAVYEVLVARYGSGPGIPAGKSYWRPQ